MRVIVADVKWFKEASPDRTDPTFYRHADVGGDVALVTGSGSRGIYVVCDGETRFNFHDDDPEFPDAVFKYADELSEYGIFTDADLTQVACEERGYWTFNSWFDLYDDTGDHLDYVTFDVYEAVDAAIKIVENLYVPYL